MIEKFSCFISGKEDIWYATNIEIADYLMAMDKLKITTDSITNPTEVPLWVQVDGKTLTIAPGLTFSKL